MFYGALNKTASVIEKIITIKDEVLFVFIRNFWPRFISPNQLSIARIFLSFYLLFLIIYQPADTILMMMVFTVGALTDLFDGAVARCFNRVTAFGKIIDPIADRCLIIPIAIFVLQKTSGILLLAIVVTEIINSLLSLLLVFSKAPIIGSSVFGKVKMFLQSLALFGLLASGKNEIIFF